MDNSYKQWQEPVYTRCSESYRKFRTENAFYWAKNAHRNAQKLSYYDNQLDSNVYVVRIPTV